MENHIKRSQRFDQQAINQRLSALEALNHPWFKKKNEIIDSKKVYHETVNNISFNIKNYKAEHKLQQAG